jgi:trans-2-enoyl-CoA reductase
MNIDKALSHLKWKFENHWKPTPKDVEAFNAILNYKDYQETTNLTKNENLAKLWIHQLILLNETDMYSAERAIQVIDEILEKPVYDWVKKLHNQVNIMRFKTLLDSKEYKKALIDLKPFNMKDIGIKTINNNEDEFVKALKEDVLEENIIKFVSSQITRVINKYEK